MSSSTPATQYGILPTAEFDGKILSGNAMISRYLAEEHGKHNMNVMSWRERELKMTSCCSGIAHYYYSTTIGLAVLHSLAWPGSYSLEERGRERERERERGRAHHNG